MITVEYMLAHGSLSGNDKKKKKLKEKIYSFLVLVLPGLLKILLAFP